MTFLSNTMHPSFDAAAIVPFSGPNGMHGALVYDQLVRVDYETGEVIPRIAESLESADNATEWTIKIREGVTFTDGTPYDADAVIFNWERMKDPALASPCKAQIDPLTYSATDDLTITVTLPEPRAAFPITVRDCLSGVASPAAIEEFGAEYGSTADKIVGAGPFMVTDYIAGQRYTLTRNPDFWDSPRPYLDELTMLLSPEGATSIDAVIAGNAGGARLSAPDADAARAREAGLIEVSTMSAGGVCYCFNVGQPPFDDVRVRQAIILASDLEDMNEKAASGHLPEMGPYYAEGSPNYDASLAQETNDLAAAQALIDEVVAETGGPVTFAILGTDTFNAIDTTMQQQWSRLENVEVTYESVPGTDRRTRRAELNYQVTPATLSCVDAECFFTQLHTTSTQNSKNYGTPELDALIDEARGVTDPERRQELFAEIVRTAIIDDPVGVLIYRLTTPTFFDPDVVGGVEKLDESSADLASLWLQ